MKLKWQQVKLALSGSAKLSADGGEWIPTVVYEDVKALASTKIPFAITKTDGMYTLTDIRSGYSIGRHYSTMKPVRAVLELLEDVSADYPDVWADGKGSTHTSNVWILTDEQRSVTAEFKRRLSQ